MHDQAQSIITRYDHLKQSMMDESVYSDLNKVKTVSKELAQLEEAYTIASALSQAYTEHTEAKELLDSETDPEFLAMAQEQLDQSKDIIEQEEEKFRIALLPQDPNDDKNIFLEIRPAAGWDEAALFASELYKSYMLYAQQQGWQTEIIDEQLTDIAWVKSVTIQISGDRVYSKMKRESWVHRVQRVPETESQWRVHTSTVTIAVVPEVEDIDITIDPNDVEEDTFAASSKWGQNANKNQTWVRLRHLPSGLIVTIGDSKSQRHNREKARQVLKSRLYQIELEAQEREQTAERLDQIWSWGRSEKIRTYNFPQDRITDHRIHESWSNLPYILQGNIDELIVAVNSANQAMQLARQAQGDS